MTSPRDLAGAAWEDFASTGRVTDAVAKLLLETTSMVARFGTTQPPGEHDRWTTEAIEDAAAGFLADPGTPRRLTTLRANCYDPRSFRLQLEAAVRNWVIDQARKTNTAHIIQRIRDVMAADPDRFTRVDAAAGVRAWTLEPHGDELFSGRHGDLIDSARAVEGLKREYWDGERRDPIAPADDLSHLLEVVLDAAGAAVDENLLAEVVADRFWVNAGPDSMPVAPESTDWEPAVDTDPGADPDVELAAHHLFTTLTDRTRTVLALADRDITDVGQALGLKDTQAYAARKQAAQEVKTLLDDHPKGQEIADRLLQIAWSWHQDRSGQLGNSSDNQWSRSDS